MTGLLNFLAVVLPLLYALTWANYALLFFRDDPVSRRTVTPMLLGTAFVHLAAITLQAASVRRCPMGNLPEILSVLALAVVAVYLVLESRLRNKSTGVFLLGLVVAVVVISSTLTPPPGPTSDLLKSPLFGAHTLLALLGYAAFGVCAVYGLMFLLLHRALKRQTFGLIFERLPSLEDLAGMTVGAAVIGFTALTLTILVGVVWGSGEHTRELLKADVWKDPKFYLTLTVWVVYGLGLLARFVLRWSNRPTVWVLLTAFLVAVLAVVALNTVVPTFHRFRTSGTEGAGVGFWIGSDGGAAAGFPGSCRIPGHEPEGRWDA